MLVNFTDIVSREHSLLDPTLLAIRPRGRYKSLVLIKDQICPGDTQLFPVPCLIIVEKVKVEVFKCVKEI